MINVNKISHPILFPRLVLRDQQRSRVGKCILRVLQNGNRLSDDGARTISLLNNGDRDILYVTQLKRQMADLFSPLDRLPYVYISLQNQSRAAVQTQTG